MATDNSHSTSDTSTYCGFFNGTTTLTTWGRTQEGIGQTSDGSVWSFKLTVESNSLMVQNVSSGIRILKVVMIAPLR